MHFKRDRKRDRGAKCLFIILISTTCRTIWNIRCERIIQKKTITVREAKARWWANMRKHLALDQAATSRTFDTLAIPKATVHDTWIHILQKDSLPKGEWIGRTEEVLVGSRSLAGEYGMT